jgi:hypothetical protein
MRKCFIINSLGKLSMTSQSKCPNCGAEVPSQKSDPEKICAFCGTAINVVGPKEPALKETEGLGYTPDPPTAYTLPIETEIPEKAGPPQTVMVNGKPVEISPEVVSTVINTGRNISRYFIIAIAVIISICTLCFMFGLFQN